MNDLNHAQHTVAKVDILTIQIMIRSLEIVCELSEPRLQKNDVFRSKTDFFEPNI